LRCDQIILCSNTHAIKPLCQLALNANFSINSTSFYRQGSEKYSIRLSTYGENSSALELDPDSKEGDLEGLTSCQAIHSKLQWKDTNDVRRNVSVSVDIEVSVKSCVHERSVCLSVSSPILGMFGSRFFLGSLTFSVYLKILLCLNLYCSDILRLKSPRFAVELSRRLSTVLCFHHCTRIPLHVSAFQ